MRLQEGVSFDNPVIIGVLLGTLLGPLLFIILMCDINSGIIIINNNCLKSNIQCIEIRVQWTVHLGSSHMHTSYNMVSFADDTRLYYGISILVTARQAVGSMISSLHIITFLTESRTILIIHFGLL